MSFTAEDKEVLEKPFLVWQRKRASRISNVVEQDQVEDPELSVYGKRRQEVALTNKIAISIW